MKVVKAIAILLIGPLLGVSIAVILALFALPPDPNFVANGGHGSPGDGFLIFIYVIFSFGVFRPSIVTVRRVYFISQRLEARNPEAHRRLNSKQPTT
jgi:hypothetical protein